MYVSLEWEGFHHEGRRGMGEVYCCRGRCASGKRVRANAGEGVRDGLVVRDRK